MASIYTEFGKDYTMQKGDILNSYVIPKNTNIKGSKEYTLRYNYGDL